MVVELLQFIRTGRFGMLGLGSPPEEVVNLLGDPGKWTTPNIPTLWQYGNVEFTLASIGVVSIEIRLSRSPYNRWPTIIFTDFDLFCNLSVESFERLMMDEGIKFPPPKIHKTRYERYGLYLLENNVRCIVEDDKLACVSVLDMLGSREI